MRLQGEWRWLAPLMAIVAVLFVLGQAIGSLADTHPLSIMIGYGLRIILVGPFVGLCGLLLLMGVASTRGEKEPLRAGIQFVRGRFSEPGSGWAVMLAVLAIPVLMGSYGLLKMTMPLIRPFAWDAQLAAADRALFFGSDPWRVTHSLFGAPVMTALIDRAYTLWVPLLMVGVLFAAVSSPFLRARYFLSFAAAWLVIGALGGYALSSAGPCYAEHLGLETASWFGPLIHHLARDYDTIGGVDAVRWQEVLWHSHAAHEYGFARGISAAPSMHNAMCTLYVLALASARPVVRSAAIAFAVTIYIGSIHLGWHYAIDGLISMGAMAAIWALTGRYLRWCGYASQYGGAGEGDGAVLAPPSCPVNLGSDLKTSTSC